MTWPLPALRWSYQPDIWHFYIGITYTSGYLSYLQTGTIKLRGWPRLKTPTGNEWFTSWALPVTPKQYSSQIEKDVTIRGEVDLTQSALQHVKEEKSGKCHFAEFVSRASKFVFTSCQLLLWSGVRHDHSDFISEISSSILSTSSRIHFSWVPWIISLIYGWMICHVIQIGTSKICDSHNCGNNLGHISSKDNLVKRYLWMHFKVNVSWTTCCCMPCRKNALSLVAFEGVWSGAHTTIIIVAQIAHVFKEIFLWMFWPTSQSDRCIHTSQKEPCSWGNHANSWPRLLNTAAMVNWHDSQLFFYLEKCLNGTIVTAEHLTRTKSTGSKATLVCYEEIFN